MPKIPEMVRLPNGQAATSEQLRPLASRCSQVDRYLYADQVFSSVSPEERVRLYSWTTGYNIGVERSKHLMVFFGLCVAASARADTTPLDVANEIMCAESAVGILL